MAVSAANSPAASSLASQLGSVQVKLREDLEVSRHVFRGEPSYIVRDPVTFESQRLDPANYQVLININDHKPLSQNFQNLVDKKILRETDEEKFYRFVMGLHKLGLLHLPISDHKLLYKRYRARERASRKQKFLGFLFIRIPLWNPNAFLDRTIQYARPLFTRPAFICWLMLMCVAGFVAFRRWHELSEPLHGIMASQNLALMWITLIALKVFHEFGHAYACKKYGGHVPEMGAYLIMFTPCAYMDATASWGFSRKLDRLIVCFGGMYFESFTAAMAVLVWAFTGPSLVNSIAYNVIFLASIITVLFNINPLMRYDGYYILSDLTEVPNLRAKSAQYVTAKAKRWLLGIRSGPEIASRRLRWLLLSFGICAFLYRISLLIAISAILASKMFLLGMSLAVFYFGSTVISTLRRTIGYLWRAEETAHVRKRAIALGVVALLIVPCLLTFVPLPSRVHASGRLTTENETIVRTKVPGFVEGVSSQFGDDASIDQTLVTLSNDTLKQDVAFARANLRATQIRRDAFRGTEPERAQQEAYRANSWEKALKDSQLKLDNLAVQSPCEGRIISSLKPQDRGLYLNEGDPIATIASGTWQVHAFLTEDQYVQSKPTIGGFAKFRTVANTTNIYEGIVVSVSPAGSRTVRLTSLTQLAGGHIVVDPNTHEAAEPYFEIVIELPDAQSSDLRHGMTGSVLLQGGAVPVAKRVARRLARFVNRLMRE